MPGDLRPEPGSLSVTTTAGATALTGGSTSDGWQLSFERLLAGLGAIQLEGEGCNGYSEPRYTRLFDFTQPLVREKLGLVYGLGDCELGFELSAPEVDALVGPGVTAADVALMRVAVDDPWRGGAEPTSVYVEGEATRGSDRKRFAWMFRQEYDIEKCAVPGLHLEAGLALAADIVIDPMELFRESAVPGAPHRFQALADHDADADGTITLEELDAPAEVEGEPSIAVLLHDTLVPRIARPSGVPTCEVELDD